MGDRSRNGNPGSSGKKERKGKRGGMTRRDFIKTVGIAGGFAALGGFQHLAALAQIEEETPVAPLPSRPLGSMRFNATVLGMGGTNIPRGEVENGVAILNRARELGINYYDTASQYGSGESERRYGLWIADLEADGHRDEIFLATKTLSRAYGDAADEIRGSLERLGTHIDLLQVHAINDEGTLRTVMSMNGSMRAIEEAKRAGNVRHIGITGHKDPQIILRALDEYPFESVLMPLGITDRMNRPFVEILPTLLEKGISVVGMKIFSEGRLVEVGADLEPCLHYTLSLPMPTAIIGMGAPEEVDLNVGWVHSYSGMTEEEKEALAAEIGEILDVSTLWWKQ